LGKQSYLLDAEKKADEAGVEIELASFMVMNGIPESVVDLCQGRMGRSIFQVSYFRPSMVQIVEQVKNALKKYEAKLEI